MTQASLTFCEGLSPANFAHPDPTALKQLQSLLNESAFWAKDRRLEDLETAIALSNPVISVWDQQQLVGFARATSDGVYRATIWDVVIHPQYRGMGLGTQVVERLLNHPHMRRVERIYLTTTYQQGFYEKLGFEVNATTTMVKATPNAELNAPELVQNLIAQFPN